MPSLSNRRQTFMTVLIVMLVLDVAAIVYLVSPLGASREKRQAERDQVQQQLQQRKREAAPLKHIDQKLDLARKQISEFFQERIPDMYSAIPDELGKVAQENNVRISQVKYATEAAQGPGLRKVEVEAGLDGDYLQIVKFINALERDKMFFMVNSVALSEQQGGAVKLQVRLETYLRPR